MADGMSRCYTYQGVHIPGCWGCAVNWSTLGHAGACICPPARPRDAPEPNVWEDPLERKVKRLEARIAELEGRT